MYDLPEWLYRVTDQPEPAHLQRRHPINVTRDFYHFKARKNGTYSRRASDHGEHWVERRPDGSPGGGYYLTEEAAWAAYRAHAAPAKAEQSFTELDPPPVTAAPAVVVGLPDPDVRVDGSVPLGNVTIPSPRPWYRDVPDNGFFDEDVESWAPAVVVNGSQTETLLDSSVDSSVLSARGAETGRMSATGPPNVSAMPSTQPYRAGGDDEHRCPDCGGPMDLKDGPYSRFWGCLRFPECRGKRNLSGAVPRSDWRPSATVVVPPPEVVTAAASIAQALGEAVKGLAGAGLLEQTKEAMGELLGLSRQIKRLLRVEVSAQEATRAGDDTQRPY